LLPFTAFVPRVLGVKFQQNFPQVKVLKFFSRAWHNFCQLVCCINFAMEIVVILHASITREPFKTEFNSFQGVLWDCGYHNLPHWMNKSLHCFDQ